MLGSEWEEGVKIITDGTVTGTEAIFIYVRNESLLTSSNLPLEVNENNILSTFMSPCRETNNTTGETLKMERQKEKQKVETSSTAWLQIGVNADIVFKSCNIPIREPFERDTQKENGLCYGYTVNPCYSVVHLSRLRCFADFLKYNRWRHVCL